MIGLVRIHSSVALSLVLAAHVCIAQSRVELAVVRNGRAVATIVLPDEPTPIEQTASVDLQRCLKRMSGATLPVVHETERPSGLCIDIGGTARGRSWRETLARRSDLSDEACVIDVSERGVVLLGRNDAATGHAVYTLLHQSGVRWLQPSLSWEIVPARETVTFPVRTQTVGPYFDRRGGLHYSMTAGDDTWAQSTQAWGRRNRLGGWDHAGSGHTYNQLVPRTLFESHPEYFSLWRGQRQTRQLCTTNPEVIQLATQRAIDDWCQNTNARIICVSPNDGNEGFCECQNCSSLRFTKGNHSDLILELANQVARAMRDKYPRRYVTFYADYHCVGTPIKVKPEKNVLFWIPQWNVDRFQPITHPRQQRFRTALKEWSKFGNPIHVYLYCGSYNHWMYYPLAHCFKVDFPFFARQGVRGVYSQTSQHWGTQGLNFYLYSRLAWDPTLDVEQLVEEFCRLGFGPAAATMIDYYALLEAAAAKGTYYTQTDVVRSFGPKVVAQADLLMAQAVRQVEGAVRDGADPSLFERIQYVAKAQRLVSLNLSAKHAMRRFFATRDRTLLALVAENYSAAIKILERPENRYLIDGDYVRKLERDLSVLSEKMVYGPGRFVYRDSFSGGGNSAIHARQLEGFHPGQWGLNLYRGQTGHAVYRFSAKDGGAFKKAILRQVRFAYSKNELSNSIGIRTPATEDKFVDLSHNRDLENNTRDFDITAQVKGMPWFEIRFSARNTAAITRLSLLSFSVQGEVAAK